MIKTLLVAGAAFGLVFGAGAASAGPCSTEIDTLQKQLSNSDAGMGPTAPAKSPKPATCIRQPTP